uniref:Glycosyltransferase n=1 Tax=Streptomyces sp. Tu1156 TaxID=430063 RepID=A4GV88_9ACTN|nr:glycosyltransferase [Streptomyces sp. Tu1156]
MRILIIPSPVVTHLMPLVPLAWALRAAGHELLVVGQPDVMGVARQAGLNAVSFGDRFGMEDVFHSMLVPGKRPIELWGRLDPAHLEHFPPVWKDHSDRVLTSYLEFARAYRPDLIVADPMEFNSLAVGGLLGVPVLHHRFGVDAVSEPVRAAARIALRDSCRALGLDELPDPGIQLDPCPPDLQLPGLLTALPIRYVPFNGSGEVPSWLREERSSAPGKRRVVVSLGTRTLALNGVPFMRGLLRAFEGLRDVEAIATIPEAFRDEIGAVPGNVRMTDPVPLHLLVETCDAVVHHGGSGTVLTTVHAGLPHLVLPQMADQFGHADQLVATGAGIMIDDAAGQNDPVCLRGALEELLWDPGYAKGAGELREAMREMPAPSEVVAGLRRLL